MQIFATTMNRQGRIVIPAPIRRAMGLEGPTELLCRYEGGTLTVETIDAAVADVRELVAEYVPAERSMVDELTRERRAEAATE